MSTPVMVPLTTVPERISNCERKNKVREGERGNDTDHFWVQLWHSHCSTSWETGQASSCWIKRQIQGKSAGSRRRWSFKRGNFSQSVNKYLPNLNTVNIASKFAGPLSSRHSLYTDDLSLFCVLPSPLEPPASPISVYYRAFPLRFFFPLLSVSFSSSFCYSHTSPLFWGSWTNMSALDLFYEAIVLGSKKHPKPADISYTYGTAGFRTKYSHSSPRRANII